jgi:hypothetical protein
MYFKREKLFQLPANIFWQQCADDELPNALVLLPGAGDQAFDPA